MAPPGLAPAPTTWNDPQVETTGQARPETVEAALRVAYDHFATSGTYLGHRKLVRVVRRYLATRVAGQTFASWLTTYADPTAVTAGRNVDRERGW